MNFEGGILDQQARVAIQLVHRLGALVVAVYLLVLTGQLLKHGLRTGGMALALVLLAQISLGISNVYFGLPLLVATAHNGGAALLLVTLVANLARTQPRQQRMFANLVAGT